MVACYYSASERIYFALGLRKAKRNLLCQFRWSLYGTKKETVGNTMESDRVLRLNKPNVRAIKVSYVGDNRIYIETIEGWFWRLRGVFLISLTLVVERKKGAEKEFKLGSFRCNPITIARCIDGCSGKRLFDWKRTKCRFLRDFILWILLPLLLIGVLAFFYKQ